MISEKKIAILLFAGSSLLCLLLLEIGTRLLVYVRTDVGMRFDSNIIYEYLPGSTAKKGTIVMNDIGCIGDDVLKKKERNEKRVLLLGESTSFSKFYVDFLRETLQEDYKDYTIKVTSCGRPRYTSFVNYNNLKKVGPLVNPDLLILYMGINDNVYNTFPWLNGLPTVGFFNWKSTDSLLFIDLFKYYVIDKKIRSTPDFKSIRSGPIFADNLEKIISLSKTNNIKLLLPTFAISYPTNDAKLVHDLKIGEPIMQHFWGKTENTALGVSAHNEITKNLASKNGISIANVSELIPKDSAHFMDLCHLTDAGYTIMVGEISKTIARDNLL